VLLVGLLRFGGAAAVATGVDDPQPHRPACRHGRRRCCHAAGQRPPVGPISSSSDQLTAAHAICGIAGMV
jgi:hypothetical protein